MKHILTLITALTMSLVAYAMPQQVQMTGSFQSVRDGARAEVVMNLRLKKETAKKAEYKGTLTFVGQVLGETQSMEFTIKKNKNKSEGVVNTFGGGYIAFDAKTAYTLEMNQQLTLTYAEYQPDDTPDFCNPIHDNFCRPMNRPPVMTDRGQLVLTVVNAQ